MAGRTLIAAALVAAGLLLGAAAGRADDDESEGAGPPPARGASLRLMTFNILHAMIARTDEQQWDKRRDGAAATIAREKPEIVGLQEASRRQVDDLLERLPGWAAFGRGPTEKPSVWHLNAVLYRTERFELIEQGELWLAEPGGEGRPAWGADFPRLLVWGRLRDREGGRELTVANAHFSHRSEEARRKSAELVRARLPELARGGELILLGDLNARPRSATLRRLTEGEAPGRLRDAYLEAGAPDEAGTLHLFEGKGRPGHRIDHVLVSGEVRGAAARVVVEPPEGGALPSDHYPVVVELRFTRAASPRPRPRTAY